MAGRWWAQLVGAPLMYRAKIELTFLPEKAEDYLHFLESGCLLASFRPFAPPPHVLVVSGHRQKSQDISPSLRGGGHSGGRTCAYAKGEGRASRSIGLPFGVTRE